MYFIAQKKPISVRARQVQEQTIIETLEGPRTAHVGDWVLTGVKGEQWPVSPESFTQKYTVDTILIDESVMAVAKTQWRVVFETQEPLSFMMRGELMKGQAGDFVIQYDAHDYAICAKDVFHATYDILEPADASQAFTLPR